MKTLNNLLCICMMMGFLANFAHAEESLEAIPVGNLRVLVIPDADGSIGRDFFTGLSKYPAYERIFENGPVPTVYRTYFLKDGKHAILFDAGWGNGQIREGQTLQLLKNVGIQPENITDVVLTHLDRDHIGGLIKEDIKIFPNANIWISRPEYEA